MSFCHGSPKSSKNFNWPVSILNTLENKRLEPENHENLTREVIISTKPPYIGVQNTNFPGCKPYFKAIYKSWPLFPHIFTNHQSSPPPPNSHVEHHIARAISNDVGREGMASAPFLARGIWGMKKNSWKGMPREQWRYQYYLSEYFAKPLLGWGFFRPNGWLVVNGDVLLSKEHSSERGCYLGVYIPPLSTNHWKN